MYVVCSRRLLLLLALRYHHLDEMGEAKPKENATCQYYLHTLKSLVSYRK